ncbi:MAG: heavy metal transporter [Bacteroidetes bacterium HGW-Bacteroidetes-21]|jgi:copper chaperone CopZ|nr:MAG: heavy metal transporter [Bacteroidetes bacterium HGW-Bacteroidetes-21]
MKTHIDIENLKCYGCANTITRSLSRTDGVTDVIVDHESNTVSVTYNGEKDRRDEFAAILKKLGYPEKGSNNAGATVKSYMSCAIGRVKK